MISIYMLLGIWFNNYTAPAQAYIETAYALPAKQIVQSINQTYERDARLRGLNLVGWREAPVVEAPTTTDTTIEPTIGVEEAKSESFTESAGGIALFTSLGVFIIMLLIIALLRLRGSEKGNKLTEQQQASMFGWGPFPGWSQKMPNIYSQVGDEGKIPFLLLKYRIDSRCKNCHACNHE